MIEIKLELVRLMSRRGAICAVLGVAMLTMIICLVVFTRVYGDIPLCLLFVGGPINNSPCQYVIAGSAISLLIILLLLCETASIACIRFTYTDHIAVHIIRSVVTLVSLVLMLCVAVVITTGFDTTCQLIGSYCYKVILPNNTSYAGALLSTILFSWLSGALLIAALVLMSVPIIKHIHYRVSGWERPADEITA